MKEKKERNFWPHAIIGIILTVVVAGAFTVDLALKNPVQEETLFMEKYQTVDKNIHKLMADKSKFDKDFDIIYAKKKFVQGSNTFFIKIQDKKTHKFIQNADITLLVTRPETNEFNQKMKPSKVENDQYIFTNIQVQRPGRWRLMTNIKVDNNYDGYDSHEVYATE
ncbi:FixH family protein [Sulfurospirillum sp. 1612]|uniref:FixH family protein n=1 Tax=Sulfurospirillum sp. 1612 TaxID=3094835 RepID=UPI002F9340C7